MMSMTCFGLLVSTYVSLGKMTKTLEKMNETLKPLQKNDQEEQ